MLHIEHPTRKAQKKCEFWVGVLCALKALLSAYLSYCKEYNLTNNFTNKKSNKLFLIKIKTGAKKMNFIRSISVDTSTPYGNPGYTEFRGVNTDTGEILFSDDVDFGTNNIGEFLAVVNALVYCQINNLKCPIYTDSLNAIAWVRHKKAKTRIAIDYGNADDALIEIEKAELWLRTNRYSNPILKWDTKRLGEIKADYGRK